MDQHWFEQEVKAFWKRPVARQILRRLDEKSHIRVTDWTAGGCALAAEAFAAWVRASTIPEGAQTQIQCIGQGWAHSTIHTLLQFSFDEVDTFLDTKGFWSREALLTKRFTRLSVPVLAPYRGAEAEGVAYDAQLQAELDAKLWETFGPFPWDAVIEDYPARYVVEYTDTSHYQAELLRTQGKVSAMVPEHFLVKRDASLLPQALHWLVEINQRGIGTKATLFERVGIHQIKPNSAVRKVREWTYNLRSVRF